MTTKFADEWGTLLQKHEYEARTMAARHRYEAMRAVITDAIRATPWGHGEFPSQAGGARGTRVNNVGVELVVGHTPKIVPHRGVGVYRWEVWIPSDWDERVWRRGLAAFPQEGWVTLDARESPLLKPEGADACYALMVAGEVYQAGRGTTVGMKSVIAVKLGNVAAAGETALQAMARAVLIWEKGLGVDRDAKPG